MAMKKILLNDAQYDVLKEFLDETMEQRPDDLGVQELWRACAAAEDEEAGMEKMAARVASRRVAFGASNGDLLHEVGRDAQLGQDEQSVSTHTDLELEDIENVDTRPKQ